jgi:tRNA pseudouridine55 synthase
VPSSSLPPTRAPTGSSALPADARPPVPSGVVVVDKPAGLTSHAVVARVRRLLGTRKVGHAGTLDPMATGVLVVGVERATRLLGHLTLTDKTYEATIRLGVGTVTDDAEGDVLTTPGLRELDAEALETALGALRGPILQVPTAVSAIKVDGVRSYARVRAGEDVALVPRPVTVHRLDVVARRDTDVDGVPVVDLDVIVDCSSGTYVRALARDLGTALGSAGHLTALRRTRVGPFGLAEAVALPEPGPDAVAPAVEPIADVAARSFPVLVLDPAQAADVRVGRRLPDLPLDGLTALMDPDGTFLALYRPAPDGARPEAVFVG